MVEHWLAEARVSRDTARFALPPSRSYLGPGDVVAVTTDEGTRRYRIDRMEQAGTLNVEAVRIEPGAYISSDEAEELAVLKPFAAPVPMNRSSSICL